MRLLFSILLLTSMISSTLVSWSDAFLGDLEKIELSKLIDGEAEDGEAESEKKIDNKLKYTANFSMNKMDTYHIIEWADEGLFHNRFREIVTPPPELK